MNEIAVIDTSNAIESSVIDFEALENDFADYAKVRPRSLRTYRAALRQLFTYFRTHGITRPRSADVVRFERELREIMKRSAATIQLYITAARLFFDWTAADFREEGGRPPIYPNIMKRYKIDETPTTTPKRSDFEVAEVKTILGKIDRSTLSGLRDYAIISLATSAALRTIEMSRARVRDLRGLDLFVQGKGKSDASESVAIGEETLADVRAYLAARGAEADEPLFTSESRRTRGEALAAKSISEIIKKRFRAAGFNDEVWTAHSLRHTGITTAYLNGESPADIQRYARHASFNTTQRYIHAKERKLNRCGASVSAAIH